MEIFYTILLTIAVLAKIAHTISQSGSKESAYSRVFVPAPIAKGTYLNVRQSTNSTSQLW